MALAEGHSRGGLLRPSQLWLDLSTKNLRVWVDETLQLPQQRGSAGQRVGFYRDIPLYNMPVESAYPQGWTSFAWEAMQGKFPLEEEFWMGLEAARWGVLESQPENFEAPLKRELPLASDLLIFAGTFDPWHEGHQACVNLAPKEFPLLVTPDRNPQKGLRSKLEVVQGYLRLKKQIKGTAQLEFYPGFLLREGPNPTVSWILRMKARRPDLRIHLLMGHDSFASLPSWIQAEDLMRLIQGLWVVPRGEEQAERLLAQNWVADHQGPPVQYLANHRFETISSTQLRRK